MGSNMLFVMPGAEKQGGMRMDRSQSQTLKLKDYEALKTKSKHLKYITPSVSSSGQVIYGNSNWPTQILGYNTDGFNIKLYTLESGEFFSEKDVASAANMLLSARLL
jgi:putative ABC transport system permease protein